METISKHFKDKSEWGDGPWQQEPDKVQWPDEATGMPCLAVRNSSGAWCGYVGVEKTHPWFKNKYNDCLGCDDPEHDGETWHSDRHSPENIIKVHGNLTYSGVCAENKEEGVCHLPSSGETDNIWWFGFDCAHAFDLAPGQVDSNIFREIAEMFEEKGNTYRTLTYVQAECKKLAEQLHNRKLP